MDNFNRFDSIDSMPLRVYNRAVFTTNLLEDAGKEAVMEYIDGFSPGERKQIYIMVAYIKQHGEEIAKKAVTNWTEKEYNNVRDEFNEQASR